MEEIPLLNYRAIMRNKEGIKILLFKPIDIQKHRDIVIKFRRDSFKVSFGDSTGFGEDEDYLHWLRNKTCNHPKGFVLIEEDGKVIGQLELSVKEFQGKRIGYVNLYYLIPEERGLGKGKELHNYAKQFFKDNFVQEYHLRVSPTNTAAIGFYRNNGMVEVGPEADGKVIRMKGELYNPFVI
ncbi:GNAT family N-acetyltransferase [Sporosarcina sp. D27]|uniref:GNAT family N-acetyltransferase n=1 Tax=Sporosarcina sp. D27 TaxID=1382305 RepID=UPI0004BBCE01|nr:GNAT family N-acetyltransferase [Sporosarcina sp. D27]